MASLTINLENYNTSVKNNIKPKFEEITITNNGTYTPSEGFDGFKNIEVNVPKRMECGDATFAPPSTKSMCNIGHTLLKTLNASCWDTSNVTDMYQLFDQCFSLQSADVSGWDTSNVTIMSYAFRRCPLQLLDLSSWSAYNVDKINNMFFECFYLKTLIGNKTITDVENDILVLRGIKISISVANSPLRFSSILALANSLADLTGITAQTLTISTASYNNMYNDNDTVPTAEVIAERQARIAAICAAKNWNFAH